MADDQNLSSKGKNTIQESKLDAGGNMHVGDVNVSINMHEKKSKNTLKIGLRVGLSISIALGIIWGGYKVVFPQPSIKKEPLGNQTKKPDEIRSPTKPLSNKIYNKIDNKVGGNATCEGEGIKGITITAESGEKTTTDENGHFQMTLKSEIQIEKVRLYFNDPSGKYDLPTNLSYNVPKSNIPIILDKKQKDE